MSYSYKNCGIFILVLLIAVASSNASRNTFETGLLKLIAKWKSGEVTSLPIALPRLPLKLPTIKFNHDGYKINLSEMTIKGLENLSVKRLSASNLTHKMSISISIPRVTVHAARCRLRGKPVSFYEIDNTGSLRAKLNNVKAAADITFGSKGANTVVKKLNFDFSVGDVQTDLSGSGYIVNNAFNRKVSNIIKRKSKQLMNRLRDMIINKVNTYLRGHTPAELIKIISSM